MLCHPKNQEVVELMMLVVVRDPEATRVNVMVNLGADHHVIITRNCPGAGHVTITENHLEAGHVIATGGLGHVSMLVDEVGHHMIEIDEADHVISIGEIGHVTASDRIDHVKGTGEGTHREAVVDAIEREILVLVIKTMKAVNQKSKLVSCCNNSCMLCAE